MHCLYVLNIVITVLSLSTALHQEVRKSVGTKMQRRSREQSYLHLYIEVLSYSIPGSCTPIQATKDSYELNQDKTLHVVILLGYRVVVQ